MNFQQHIIVNVQPCTKHSKMLICQSRKFSVMLLIHNKITLRYFLYISGLSFQAALDTEKSFINELLSQHIIHPYYSFSSFLCALLFSIFSFP